MKKVIKLTETDLHRIVENAINTLMNESPSEDTIDSAADGARQKWLRTQSKYGLEDPRTKRAGEQLKNFQYKWADEYNHGNDAKKARMLDRREKRKTGQRTYIPGTGWRNKQ